MEKTVLFIGRFQLPNLHAGHIAFLRTAVEEKANIVIGLRDTKNNEHNPYSYEERKAYIEQSWRRHFPDYPIEIISIPDIGCNLEVRVGRNVGYTVIKLCSKLETISATAIRENAK